MSSRPPGVEKLLHRPPSLLISLQSADCGALSCYLLYVLYYSLYTLFKYPFVWKIVLVMTGYTISSCTELLVVGARNELTGVDSKYRGSSVHRSSPAAN